MTPRGPALPPGAGHGTLALSCAAVTDRNLGGGSVNRRKADQDVTGTVRISDPLAVRDTIDELLADRYGDYPRARLQHAVETFIALYTGSLRGYLGCDTWYHDVQHSLDCTLAMARLVVSHDAQAIPQRRLGAELALFGVICALFHDAGYIRRDDEADIANGAALTLTHVERSARFLDDYLPTVGCARLAPVSHKIVHFTGYEIALDRIRLRGYKHRMLGNLLGTADILSQCSDRCYLEKCFRYLYREFEYCGLAGKSRSGGPVPVYSSPEDLIRKTPAFVQSLFDNRLDSHFGRAYRLVESEFPEYLDSIRGHVRHAEKMIAAGNFSALRRRIRRHHAPVLRQSLRRRGEPLPSAQRLAALSRAAA